MPIAGAALPGEAGGRPEPTPAPAFADLVAAEGPAQLSARPFGGGGPTLQDVGERGLVQALVQQSLRTLTERREPIVASGDDAAVLTTPAGRALVVTQDALVERVDFDRTWTTPYQLGRRALTISLSDLAATGSEPAFCLLTICAHPTTPALDVVAIEAGCCDAAVAAGCAVVGGDVSSTDGPLVLDVMAGGFVEPDRALRRDAGRPGDLLMVTGILGRAAAGLALLQGRLHPTGTHPSWVDAQLSPTARIAEGRGLAVRGVRCAGDLSDGLWIDTERTAAASNCGAELWWASVPVDAELRARPDAQSRNLALAGGEDFELLAAAAPEIVDQLLSSWPAGLAPLSVVGRLVAGTGVRLLTARGGAPLEHPVPTSLHFQ